MKKLRRIAENEVLSEFLKAEFYQPEYDRDRARFEAIVYEPNLADEVENALRRALMFRRRGNMLRELPPDTQWSEVEFMPEDVERVSVFPRAQWRAAARGNFKALHVAEVIQRELKTAKTTPLALKIEALRSLMQHEGPQSTVLLIGIDEEKPVTLLEGNHRFVAGLLLPPEIMFRRIRMVCGFSPRMEKCCWYKTSIPTLSRYLKNRIIHLWNREADVSPWLPLATRAGAGRTLANSAATSTFKSE